MAGKLYTNPNARRRTDWVSRQDPAEEGDPPRVVHARGKRHAGGPLPSRRRDGRLGGRIATRIRDRRNDRERSYPTAGHRLAAGIGRRRARSAGGGKALLDVETGRRRR